MVKFAGRQTCCSIEDEPVVAHVAAGRQNICGIEEKNSCGLWQPAFPCLSEDCDSLQTKGCHFINMYT